MLHHSWEAICLHGAKVRGYLLTHHAGRRALQGVEHTCPPPPPPPNNNTKEAAVGTSAARGSGPSMLQSHSHQSVENYVGYIQAGAQTHDA